MSVAGFGEEQGGARESLSASDNSAMLRLCRGAVGDSEPASLFAGTIFSLLLLDATSDTMLGNDTMLGETLQLRVFVPSSALGVLLDIGHPMTVDPVDCLKEVGVVLVEERGVKKARAAKVVGSAELLDLISDADDIMQSELSSCWMLSKFNCVPLPSSTLEMPSLAFPTFSSVIILPSSFPLPSSFCCSSMSFFASSKLSFSPPSSSPWSQIMEASMLLRCSDPGEAAGLSDAHPDPDPDLSGDVHPNIGFCPPLLLG